MAQIQYDLNSNLNPAQTSAFISATTAWEGTLQNDVRIFIRATILAFPPQLNHLSAMCIPNFIQIGNLPAENGQPTTLATSQAKAMGLDVRDILNGLGVASRLDMVVLINNGNPHFETNFPNNPQNQNYQHFKTTMLHEICHGLGFIGLCNVRDNTAFCSDTNLLDILNHFDNIEELIPFYAHLRGLANNYPTIMAHRFRVIDTNAEVAINVINGADNGAAMIPWFTTPNTMYIDCGADHYYKVYSGNGGRRGFAPFSSCDHIDYPESLMYYTFNGIMNEPDYRTKKVLQAIGWNVAFY